MTTANADDTAKDLFDASDELAEIAERLQKLAKQLTKGQPSREEDAVLALTDAGKELVRYLLTGPDAGVDYGTATIDLGMTPAALGGVCGGIKRRQLKKMPPVVDYAAIEGKENQWLVRIDPRYLEAAKAVL